MTTWTHDPGLLTHAEGFNLGNNETTDPVAGTVMTCARSAGGTVTFQDKTWNHVGNPGVGRLQWSLGGSDRVLIEYLADLISTTGGSLRLIEVRHAGGILCRVTWETSGTIRLYNAANSAVFTSTTTYPAYARVRIMLGVEPGTTTSNGRLILGLYSADSGMSSLPDEAVFDTSTANAGTAPVALVYFGRVNSDAGTQGVVRTVSLQAKDDNLTPMGPLLPPVPEPEPEPERVIEADIDLEARVPVSGVFVLGRTALGDPVPLAGDEQAAEVWRSLLCEATGVHVERGGRADAVGVTIDVGTLDASFVDGLDPTEDPDVRPGVPLRVVHRSEAQTFPQQVATLTGNPQVGTTTYNVTTDDPASEWEVEAVVSAAADITGRWNLPGAVGVTSTGPGSPITVRGRFGRRTLATTPVVLRFTRPGAGVVSVTITSMRVTRVRPLITTTTDRVRASHDKITDRLHATLKGVDAVATLANTPRYGAANPVQEWEPWTRRVERILTSTGVPAHQVVDPDRTQVFGNTSTEGNLWDPSWTRVALGGGEYALQPPASAPTGTSRTLDGLLAGFRYRITLDYGWSLLAPAIVSVDTGDTTDLPYTGGSVVFEEGWVEFTATHTSHVITISRGGLSLTPMRLRGWSCEPVETFQCANVVYSSTVRNHLTLATNSGASGWFVDRNDIIGFKNFGEVVAEFSDEHTADPLHVCYTDVGLAFDTDAMTNALSLDNHARKWDDEVNDWRADDSALGPYRDPQSESLWGTRGASLPTSVPPSMPALAASLAAEVMAGRTTPQVRPDRVTFAGHDHPDIASTLEPYDRVTVRRKGTTYGARVVGITHDITPHDPVRWTVTLTLTED